MAAEQPRTPPPDAGAVMSRRSLLKAGAGAAAVGAVTTSGGRLEELSPVGDADAFLGPGIAVDAGAWVAGQIGVLGSDGPPEGLTTGALKEQVYRTARTRKSTNASTFVDNRNIINYLPEVAFSDAKKAAIEALNNGKSKSEVQSAAQSAANTHYVTVEKNLLKSWNESVSELSNMVSTVKSHPDVSMSDIFYEESGGPEPITDISTGERSVTLSDGSTFQAKTISLIESGSTLTEWTINWRSSSSSSVSAVVVKVPGTSIAEDRIQYLDIGNDSHRDWRALWDDLQSQFDTVDSDIATWVDTTYDQYQQGEIDSEDLISGTDLANMSDVPRALAHLIAANVPVDVDNQLTIEMGQQTMSGYLATTDQNALSEVAPGDTIDPNATDADGNPLYGTIYLAQDFKEWRYDWQAYDDSKGVDGGTVWYTRDPSVIDDIKAETTLFHAISTTAGETATVTPADFTETTDGSGNTVWEVDLSSKLSTTITDIDSITVSLDTDSTYSLTKLDESFEVLSTESGDSINLTQNRDPQTDSNYISPEEWEQMQANQDRLIELYKEDKNDGGVNLGVIADGLFSALPIPSIPTLPGLGLVESIVVVVLGFLGISAATS